MSAVRRSSLGAGALVLPRGLRHGVPDCRRHDSSVRRHVHLVPQRSAVLAAVRRLRRPREGRHVPLRGKPSDRTRGVLSSE